MAYINITLHLIPLPPQGAQLLLPQSLHPDCELTQVDT